MLAETWLKLLGMFKKSFHALNGSKLEKSRLLPFNMTREETNARFALLPDPRAEVHLTLANGHLSPGWYNRYMLYAIMERPHDRVQLQNVFQGRNA